MTIGCLVQSGVVIVELLDAASDLDLNYQPGPPPIAFVPDPDARIGDLWDGSKFTYLQSPKAVTPLQIRMELTAVGRRSVVETAVATLTQDQKDYWNFSPTIARNSSLVLAIMSATGTTATQMDNFFRAAAKL